MPKSIALIGMPGGGKSTIGRNLAKRLDWVFQDSDTLIERQIGQPIRDFFDQQGEARFREIEAEAIACLAAKENSVIATGGGAVLNPASRRLLHACCHVVYLRSSPDELFRRLRHDTQRPLLQVKDPLAQLKNLYVARDPLYRDAAHFVVDTGRPSVAALVNMLMMQLELAGIVNGSVVPDRSASTGALDTTAG